MGNQIFTDFLENAISAGTVQDLRRTALPFGLVGGMWYSHSKSSFAVSRFTGLLVLSSRSSLQSVFILNIYLIQ